MNDQKNQTTYLSVIVPAYNEEDKIESTLHSINAYLSRQAYLYEVIVVNDGSKDGTAHIVSRLVSELPYLRLIDNRENRGKGWSVRQGMLSARGEITLFMDADNSTTLDQFDRMIPHLQNGFDVVIGSRRVEGAVISLHQPWFRENVGRVVNLIVRFIHGIPMEDTQAGFKAFSGAAAEKIFPLQTIWQWVFDVELLAISRKLGFKVKEVPIVWKNDPKSQVKLKHTIKTLVDLVKIRLNLWSGVYDRSL